MFSRPRAAEKLRLLPEKKFPTAFDGSSAERVVGTGHAAGGETIRGRFQRCRKDERRRWHSARETAPQKLGNAAAGRASPGPGWEMPGEDTSLPQTGVWVYGFLSLSPPN